MKGRASRQNVEGWARGKSAPAPPLPKPSRPPRRPGTTRNRRRAVTQRRGTPGRHSPTRATTQRPHSRLAWYTGLAVMAVLEVIEWPLVIVLVLGHEIAHRAHNEALRNFAEGVEAGACAFLGRIRHRSSREWASDVTYLDA